MSISIFSVQAGTHWWISNGEGLQTGGKRGAFPRIPRNG